MRFRAQLKLIVYSHIPTRPPFPYDGYDSGANAKSDGFNCADRSLKSSDRSHTKPRISGRDIDYPESRFESCALDYPEASSRTSLARHLAPPKVHRDRFSRIRFLFFRS